MSAQADDWWRYYMDGWLSVDGETAWPGQYHDHQRWNGFACPRFTRQTAENLARWFVSEEPGQFDAWFWDGDTLVLCTGPDVVEPLADPEHDPVEHFDEYADRWEPDAQGYYHVGSWAWCWMNVDGADLVMVDGVAKVQGR